MPRRNHGVQAVSGASQADHSADLTPLVNITTLVYVLQALSFFVGISCIFAVIINYVKLPDVSGSWLASHFRWQIRTFWFSMLWLVLGGVTLFLLVGYFVLVANAVWFIYRIVKGWLYLSDRKPMYVPVAGQ
jgi:uncharacterized membrane protein